VFRHGERTPSDTYPEDPYFNFTFEPVGWGQLTNVGKLSQYQQGQYLRTRYGEFLGNIYTQEDYNLTLPEWTHGIYPDRLIPLTVFSFVLNAYNDELQKLKGGLLLKKILSDTKAKTDRTLSPADRKMYMYAGHDSTVTNLLSALKVWDHGS
ncbi:hypothetical protein ANN_08141, partial [Periplaneta americana]